MAKSNHTWHFVQTGGLVQLKINSIEDVLNLKELDQKLWVALACPVKGLEFSEETLSLLDTDHNGRVRVPEILDAVEFIRKYITKPEVIMKPGISIPLDSLSTEPFACGHSPIDSAKAVLHILGKDSAKEISLDDVSVNDKLFAPNVINGDGVLPPEAVKDEATAAVVKDIIACTGGTDDISGVKGITREQYTSFFADLRSIRDWRESAQKDAPDIFFLKLGTDAAASIYMKVKDKIDEYFLRCSLASYNGDVSLALRKKEEEACTAADLTQEQLAALPLALIEAGKALPFGCEINPAWAADMETFRKNVIVPLFDETKTNLTEAEWKKIETNFGAYMAWYAARPANGVATLSFERVDEILASDAEQIIAARLDEEEKHPPIALATVDLRKMLLYRRDFVELLRNYVSFEDFYSFEDKATFQCGTLYIDGRSCDLCFRVLDGAKHATMSPLSQCYLLYCDCKRPSENKTLQIAALVSAGSCDNLIVGRNGLFYDRDGNDWDATITKIIENPISIKEAFFSPYKKLARMIQERIAKSAAEAEKNVNAKMAATVDKPSNVTEEAKANAKKFDVGTIAALGVAVSGFAAVIGSVLGIITQKWWMPPVFIIGLLFLISFPSMLLAWLKLRQRNIAPILDASGWAINGNVKINIPLGRVLTKTGVRPKGSKLNPYDPYRQKNFPWKRLMLCVILLAIIVAVIIVVAKSGWNVHTAWDNVVEFVTVKIPGIFVKENN
ncbi:MAG: hypothetical protein IJP62_12580 [Treponema sp.]|nr:hypothetical protein [Treponema sp.]